MSQQLTLGIDSVYPTTLNLLPINYLVTDAIQAFFSTEELVHKKSVPKQRQTLFVCISSVLPGVAFVWEVARFKRKESSCSGLGTPTSPAYIAQQKKRMGWDWKLKEVRWDERKWLPLLSRGLDRDDQRKDVQRMFKDVLANAKFSSLAFFFQRENLIFLLIWKLLHTFFFHQFAFVFSRSCMKCSLSCCF